MKQQHRERIWSLVRSLGPVAFLALAGGFCVWFIAQRDEEIIDALGRIRAQEALSSLVAAALGFLAIFRAWLVIVRGAGIELTARQAFGVFSVGQIGKYLPGSVWSVVGPAQLGKSYGASRASVAAATLVALMISVSVALAMGAVMLPAVGDLPFSPWLVGAFGLAMAVFLVPRALNFVLLVGARTLRRPVLLKPVAGTVVVRSASWCCLANLCFGAHVWALASGFGMDGGVGYVIATCGYALAAGLGVLIVLAPAGVGAREGVLVVVLATAMSTAAAVTIALLSRLITIAVELAFAVSQVRSLTKAEADNAHS